MEYSESQKWRWYKSSRRTVGHRWNNPQMLVHITSITTIPTSWWVNPLQICHIFEKKVTKHSLYRPLHLVNFWSPKCRKCQFRGLRNANFDGGESPRTTLKGCRHSYFDTHPPPPRWKIVPTALWTFPSNHLLGCVSFHRLYYCVIQAVQNTHM